MKQRYDLSSYCANNSLELLARKDGSESKTYIVKTSCNIVRTGKTNDGDSFLDLSGGPMIVVGKPLEDADNAIVKSIDRSEGFGFTVTFK